MVFVWWMGTLRLHDTQRCKIMEEILRVYEVHMVPKSKTRNEDEGSWDISRSPRTG